MSDQQARPEGCDCLRWAASGGREHAKECALMRAARESARSVQVERPDESARQVGAGEDPPKPYELRSARYEIRRATEELDRAGVEKYDNREPSMDSTDESVGTGAEWSIQYRIALLHKQVLAAARLPERPDEAKTHDYHLSDWPPVYEAMKRKLYELGLASGDEAVTNARVEALCAVASPAATSRGMTAEQWREWGLERHAVVESLRARLRESAEGCA